MTYYASRQDVLALWSGSLADLPALSGAFDHPKVDFGKESRHPLQDIIRAVGDKTIVPVMIVSF